MDNKKIPIQIQEVESMDVFDKMLIWNHRNVDNIYHRTKCKLSEETDYWKDIKIDWTNFNQSYIQEETKTIVNSTNGQTIINKETKLVGREKPIHHWYHLFKKEIFK